MTADRWTQAVRHQLGIGRLLPLGDARDGAWIAERAAEAVLRSAAWDAPGVRLDALRIAVADPEDTAEPAVPAPPSALPPGPLRVTAEFSATASQPLPTTASLLRATLATAATQRLGLVVTEVDLKVTGLLDDEGPGEAGIAARLPEPPSAAPAGGGDEGRVAAAALGVEGVLRLTGALGHPVHIEELPHEGAALPHRHIRLELAVGADRRARDVAREVRTMVRRVLPDHPTVAVVVSAIG
ncbi:nucleopolyhedrovirus P10 family protein [Streptomyces massasporeus]|uniref:nucleopolyhedrovirus P10 family protein n=1 Tax=Streptomyces massasporeus TaxID=67324 RepID=UPI0037F38D34